MRDIPLSLKEKIEQTYQTIHHNAHPQIDIFVGREGDYLSALERFFVITIQDGQTLNRIDVATARPDPYYLPTELTIVYLVDDDAYVATTPMPVHPKSVWTVQGYLGKGVDVTLEFEGYWARRERAKENFEDPRTSRFSIVTVGDPWFFVTRLDGSVEARQGLTGSWTTIVASDVTRIDALAGWKGMQVTHEDQGLVVAYIQNGSVWYRNRAEQENGTIVWETEKAVTDLPSNCVNVSLFRTNDYRLGFIVETDDDPPEIYWVLTVRCWSGMALPSETFINPPTVSNLALSAFGVEHFTLGSPNEVFDEAPHISFTRLSAGSDALFNTPISVIVGQRTSDKEFYIKFSHPIHLWNPSRFLTSGLTMPYTLESVLIDGDTLWLTTIEDTELLGFSITLNTLMVECILSSHCYRFLEAQPIVVKGMLGTQEVTFDEPPQLRDLELTGYFVTSSSMDTPDETFEGPPTVHGLTLTQIRIDTLPI